MMPSRDDDGHLTGMLLVAMPTMQDPRFAHSVIYLCAHSREGAMGLVVNQVVDNVTLPHVIGQLGIEAKVLRDDDLPVHFGGPVETSRGFVLHSPDYVLELTLVIDDSFALTATVDVLKAIAEGTGPSRRFFALGYAGWGAGPARQGDPGRWPGCYVPADQRRLLGRGSSRPSGIAPWPRSASTRICLSNDCRRRLSTVGVNPTDEVCGGKSHRSCEPRGIAGCCLRRGDRRR